MAASSSARRFPTHPVPLDALAQAAPFATLQASATRRSLRLVLRMAASAALIAALLAGCLQFPHADHATVALLLIAATVAIAAAWGRAEALACAIAGGVGLDYYFLPPRGFGISRPEHIVALATFLFVAAAIGQVAARSRQLLSQRDGLLHLSLDPLCLWDLNGHFRSANQAMVELLGWPENELRARPFLDLVHPEDRLPTQAALGSFSHNRAVVDVENRCRTKDGGWRWLHWKIAPPVPGASWLSAAARDVTGEKWAREKLRCLATQVMTAQEEERRRIAGELHDDITQRLASFGMRLGLAKRTVADAAASRLPEELSRLQAEAAQLAEDVRGLSHSLHPSILEHADLVAGLEAHCREFAAQHRIPTDFVARDVPGNVPRPAALALYRIAQESLRNVARHSGATNASVVLAGESGGLLALFVIDNGKGFDVAKAKTSPGLGLVSIEERARLIGAAVTIDSMCGEGTTLTVRAPIPEGTPVEE